MAAGDLSVSTCTYCSTEAEITAAIEADTLPATTDNLFVIPWKNGAMVIIVDRAAS